MKTSSEKYRNSFLKLTASPARSKREQVESFLLQNIRNGSIAIGETIPSEATLARDLNVSRVTVRNAIQTLSGMGMLESQAGRGHLVMEAEMRPRIALLFGNYSSEPLQTSFYSMVMEHCQREVERHQHRLELYMIRLGSIENLRDHDRLIEDTERGNIKGVLALAWPSVPEGNRTFWKRDNELMDCFRKHQLPFIGTNSRFISDFVACNYHQIGFMGTTHFLSQGLRRIGLVVSDTPSMDHENTIRGYRDALRSFDLPFDDGNLCYVKELSEAGAYRRFMEWWPGRETLEALVINDDILCKGILSATQERGIGVPENLQVAALALKDSPLFFPRPVVRLEIDTALYAKALVNNLLERIQNPGSSESSVQISPRIVTP